MELIKATDAFKALIENIKTSTTGYKDPIAFGICRVDLGQLNHEKSLQAIYPHINWNENFGSAAIFIKALAEQDVEIDFTQSEVVCNINIQFLEKCLAAFDQYVDKAYGDAHKNIQVVHTLYRQIRKNDSLKGEFKVCFIFEDTPLKSVEASYLKLYAISQAKVELRSICLDGAFGVLPNVAWSQGEPIELDYLRKFEIKLKLANKYPHIDFVDKFPRFLQHIIPQDNTRILDTSKVRFGAQLAGGTTVMPGASYINFNAGTTGTVMVEGRISSSAIVGDGSDVGGGASILGTLSGGNTIPMSLGKNSLLGANSVMGIPLGNETTLSASIAILEGTRVIIDPNYLDQLQEKNPDLDLAKVKTGADIVNINRALILPGNKNDTVLIKWNKKPNKLNADLH